MKQKNTKLLVISALLAAAIMVCTRFTSIPIFSGMGYVHIGDAIIFLAAALLPTPYAMISCAIGGALADLLSGFAAYILPTAIVKALMALMFAKSKSTKLLSGKNIFSVLLATIVLVVGYYIAEVIMYRSFISPLMGMVWNLAQGIFSGLGFIVLATALDSAKAKERLGV